MYRRMVTYALCISVLLTISAFVYFAYSPVGSKDWVVTVDIPKGMRFYQIVNLLDEKGLVTNKPFFYVLSLMKGSARVIRAGEYEFSGSLSPLEILDKLVRGNLKYYLVTIPEDTTLREIADRLAALNLVKKEEFIKAAHDKAFLASLNIEGESAEGYLYPETYKLDRSMGEREIIRVMVGQFWKVFTPELRNRARELGMTIDEVVTLASLIGKETGLAAEKPLISAVFHNRLRRGMKLQCDPTAVYNLANFEGVIKRRHLQLDHPYNTYKISGLPPGPIANPDITSLRAALYPAKVSYLYFVADNEGTHVFSRSLEEHNQAILSYQIKKKKDE